MQSPVQGQPVALIDMLDAREHRQAVQQQLQSAYQMPLVSFTLNIAGPIKVFPHAVQSYTEGVLLIQQYCKTYGLSIVHLQEIHAHTGNEAFFCMDAPAMKIKQVLARLELTHSLGRFFDIDVIDVGGRKISRAEIGMPARKCLLCGQDAFVCSRARAHTVEALQIATYQCMHDYFALQYAKRLGRMACRALLHEVATTPKPGLVDSANNGAHTDMDCNTFETSALTLLPYYTQFVLCGMQYADLQAVFKEIRNIGIDAELAMLRATNGVNTHKGILFSLGIVCAALGYLYAQNTPATAETIQQTCATMTQSLAQDFVHITPETATSHGERVFLQYGSMGIRGQAMSGFSDVFAHALPHYRTCLAQGHTTNDAAVSTLLCILTCVEDTNVINRANYATLQQLQGKIRAYFTAPGDLHAFVEALNDWCVARNVSPGGSADLLALTLFLDELGVGEDWKCKGI